MTSGKGMGINMSIQERYMRNIGAFSEKELDALREKRICVIGCGGLGGFVCHGLARFGVGHLTLVDGDAYTESNLNRQMFSSDATLGINKALVCRDALSEINREVSVAANSVMLTQDNAAKLLAGHDLAMDCLDNIAARRTLAKACADLGIPLVHGAISGLYGQVACVFPGDILFEYIYPRGAEPDCAPLGNPVFTAQLVAAVQACEAVKVLAGHSTRLRNSVLYIDLQNTDFEVVSFPDA